MPTILQVICISYVRKNDTYNSRISIDPPRPCNHALSLPDVYNGFRFPLMLTPNSRLAI